VTKIPIIIGTTAVGKTAVAVEAVEFFNAEIISADSRQIYAGMEIGSGAPSKEELTRVPHHLISIIAPDQRLSAGEFARMAHDAIRDVRERGKVPIVVGGSGLYIRALIDGLAPIPPVDLELRASISSEIDRCGMTEMIAELTKIDPEYANKVGINDRKRLIRAIEVWRMTGQSFTDWHRETDNKQRYKPYFYGLIRPRPELLEIIERRVRGMITVGWVQEILRLADDYDGLDNLPSVVSEGLGYRNIIAYIKGEIHFENMIEKIVISTRQFAKRQMTWFQSDERIVWREESGDEAVRRWVEWLKEEIIQNFKGAFLKGEDNR